MSLRLRSFEIVRIGNLFGLRDLRVAQSQTLRAAVDGVTTAATGAIAGAVIVLARRGLIDVPTWIIFAAAAAAVLGIKKAPEPLLIVAAGIAGIAVHGAVP